ncbi:hypothetical protein ASPZODRAFT_19786 [Penicilliopsis zonata CBS 506.65]|uniref:Uncharacterized protein n=1 Tax=Penicilliopsis zonata CBS 506.65 TaxID=1073090 RepID=A0A1L9S7F7_9EURO|nr:hypothetical protein ASPZODRAFT_19786 [Penicilliopsis zonata CBS 506.65]OJJ43089.1 hypothetical protein ASPZODRAFT_19786 [Penicilliopsis zonata CBS 506.65]
MPVIAPDASPFKKNDSGSSTQQKSETKKAHAMDHISKGPAIPEEMPPKASKEEIDARMKELNKK